MYRTAILKVSNHIYRDIIYPPLSLLYGVEIQQCLRRVLVCTISCIYYRYGGNLRSIPAASLQRVTHYYKIETIVSAGTRINLDYYIRQHVDDDKITDIYDYFKEEAATDSVIEAMKALGPDYEEEEVRLIRIKFMSELGN